MFRGELTLSLPALRDAIRLRAVRWCRFAVSIEVTDDELAD